MKFTIEINDPVHSDFVKDCTGEFVKILDENNNVIQFVQLGHWETEELVLNLVTGINTLLERK